jgi:hypothetical protein
MNYLQKADQILNRKKFDQDGRAKLTELASVIRLLGESVNEEKEFLEAYIKEQVSAWSHNLDAAITCFEDLIKR